MGASQLTTGDSPRPFALVFDIGDETGLAMNAINE